MKATLHFDLPEEMAEYQQAVNAGKWEYVLWQLDMHFRDIVKYSDNDVDADYAEKVREKIYELMSDSQLFWSE